MPTYVVYCTNPVDMLDAGPLSYTSGRYGFQVRADDLGEALKAAVIRARSEGMYGQDWSAQISEVGAHGKRKSNGLRGWASPCEARLVFRNDLGHPAYRRLAEIEADVAAMFPHLQRWSRFGPIEGGGFRVE